MTIKVCVIGANGKMGHMTVDAIKAADDMTLIATCGSKDKLADILNSHQPDVAVDFSLPHVVFENTIALIEHGVHPIVGATGLSNANIADISRLASTKHLGGIYAPNFSLGAVLMMQFAQQAAKHFPSSEIIEMHHDQKVDAPSGTAIRTQQMMGTDTPIHSVRLPGLFAHQMVMFGSRGETLTIRHDAQDRACMMPGVLLACRQVSSLGGFVVGLESLL